METRSKSLKKECIKQYMENHIKPDFVLFGEIFNTPASVFEDYYEEMYKPEGVIEELFTDDPPKKKATTKTKQKAKAESKKKAELQPKQIRRSPRLSKK